MPFTHRSESAGNQKSVSNSTGVDGDGWISHVLGHLNSAILAEPEIPEAIRADVVDYLHEARSKVRRSLVAYLNPRSMAKIRALPKEIHGAALVCFLDNHLANRDGTTPSWQVDKWHDFLWSLDDPDGNICIDLSLFIDAEGLVEFLQTLP